PGVDRTGAGRGLPATAARAPGRRRAKSPAPRAADSRPSGWLLGRGRGRQALAAGADDAASGPLDVEQAAASRAADVGSRAARGASHARGTATVGRLGGIHVRLEKPGA